MDTQFLPQLNTLLDCFCAALATNPKPPAKCCVYWGDPVADIAAFGDDCCDGAAYVSLEEFYPSTNLFPDRTIERQSGPCGILAWSVRLKLTTFRCWPVPANVNSRITCEQTTSATDQMFHDAKSMREAFCCFQKVNRLYLTAVTQVQPISPQGGCAGLQGFISIQLPNCDAIC